jgi:YidC/Oxa1 family membrane protein insertase
MQDQGKRLIIAVALALGVLLLWQKLFPQKEEPKSPVATASGSGGVIVGSSNKPTSLVGYDGEAPAATAQVITLKFPDFAAEFTNIDGALSSWHLSDARYVGDLTKGQLVADQPDLALGFTKSSTFKLPKHAVWTGTQLDAHRVQYKLSTDALDITKTFEVVPDSYLVRLTVGITAKQPGKQRLALSTYQFQDPKHAGGGSSRIAPRVWNSSTMRDGVVVQSELKDVQEHPRFEPNVTWTGFEHPFLLVGFSPRPVQTGSIVEKHTYADDAGHMQTDLIYQEVDLKPGGGEFTREVVGYLGPKNYDDLNHANAVAGYLTGFHATVDLGWFGFLGKRLLWLLLKFQGVVGNWGVAIILLTVVVKLATLYWMTKSMRSMKAMAVLGPQIKVLNEKYKGDKSRLQVETMALYKQNGANPLSGCAPMFLQMPIWISLYRMLGSVGELYRQPFIPGWINDLTSADPYYILPVVLVVTMFAQARLTPQNPDPAQKTQQKIMQYGMPLLFGGMAFVFPAGLTLYIFTNTCLSALHSIYMNKFDKKSLALTAKIKAAQEAAAAGKTGAVIAKAKNANVVVDTSDDDDTDDDEAAEPNATTASRGASTRQPKKKKGRR